MSVRHEHQDSRFAIEPFLSQRATAMTKTGRVLSGLNTTLLVLVVALTALAGHATSTSAPGQRATDELTVVAYKTYANYKATTDLAYRTRPIAAPGAPYGVRNGESYGVECQWAKGEALGPNKNRLYFWIHYKGTGTWVPDAYSTSPHKGSDPGGIPGIPNCSSTSGGIASSTPATSASSSKAAAWAKSQMGSTNWNDLCLSFARNAWLAGGVDIRSKASGWSSDTYPDDIWKHFKSGTWGTGKPPKAGALLFFASPKGRTHSHIEVWNGTQMISSGYTSTHYENRVHYEPWGGYYGGAYRGWWIPA